MTVDWVVFPYLVVIMLVISGTCSLVNFGTQLLWSIYGSKHLVNTSHTWSPGGLAVPYHQHLVLNSLLQFFFTLLFICSVFWFPKGLGYSLVTELGSSSVGCGLAVSHLSTSLVSLGWTLGSGWQHWQLQWTGKVVLRQRLNGFCQGRIFHKGNMHFSCYSSNVVSHPMRKHRFTISYLRWEGVSWSWCPASCFVAFSTDRKLSKSSRADFILIEILLCALFVMFSSGWNQRCLHVVSSSKAPQRKIWRIGFLYPLLLQNIRLSFGVVSGRKKPIISRYFNSIYMFVLFLKLHIDTKI